MDQTQCLLERELDQAEAATRDCIHILCETVEGRAVFGRIVAVLDCVRGGACHYARCECMQSMATYLDEPNIRRAIAGFAMTAMARAFAAQREADDCP